MNDNYVPPIVQPIIALKNQYDKSLENKSILGKRLYENLSKLDNSYIQKFNRLYDKIIKIDKETYNIHLEKLYPDLHYYYMSMTEEEKSIVLDKKTHLFKDYLKIFNLT